MWDMPPELVAMVKHHGVKLRSDIKLVLREIRLCVCGECNYESSIREL